MEPIRTILPRVLSALELAELQERLAYQRLQDTYRALPDEPEMGTWDQLRLELAEAAWKLRFSELLEVNGGR